MRVVISGLASESMALESCTKITPSLSQVLEGITSGGVHSEYSGPAKKDTVISLVQNETSNFG